MSVEDATTLKNKGNAAFQAGNHDEAIDWFSQAIELDGTQHTFYSNRSAAYLSKGDGANALSDANKCIQINPAWAKGFSRKGAALHSLNKLDESIAAYQEGLKLDPSNAALQNGLREVQAEKEEQDSGLPNMANLFGNDMWMKIGMNPKLKPYLEDPSYVQALQRIQANPNSLQAEMNDKRIMETFMALMGMNFNMPAEGDFPADAGAAAPEPAAPAAAPAAPAKAPEPEFETEEKAQANALKLEGNALYKKREFEGALAKYTEAIAADGTDMSFYTNRAAVYLEMKDYANCMDDCKTAVSVGRANRAKYELVAKAFARMGTAAMRQKDYGAACEHFENSLVEHRTNDVDKKLKLAKKKKKEADALAYLDPEEGNKAKLRGNEHFKSGDFAAAVKEYTDAIARNPNDATYFCNRGAAYTKLTDFVRGRNDVEQALKLDPKYVKAWTRLGAIQYFMKEYHKALDSYKSGLALDPQNAECQEGLQRVQYAVQQGASGGVDKERAAHGMADPEIQAIMSDPMMQQVLRDFSENPMAAQKHLRDAGVAAKLEKLIAAGVLQVG